MGEGQGEGPSCFDSWLQCAMLESSRPSMNFTGIRDPADSSPAQSGALSGARSALVLLLLINLFNYIDRYVLAAVVPDMRRAFFNSTAGPASSLAGFLDWFQRAFGFKPENALLGMLSMAFM